VCVFVCVSVSVSVSVSVCVFVSVCCEWQMADPEASAGETSAHFLSSPFGFCLEGHTTTQQSKIDDSGHGERGKTKRQTER
jgi:hypothetical protein